VDVTVEPGKEPESVLARQELAAFDRAVRYGDAAGFAAKDRLAFEDANLEAALGQFVRRAQPAYPAAQNHDCLSHPLSTSERGDRKRGRKTDTCSRVRGFAGSPVRGFAAYADSAVSGASSDDRRRHEVVRKDAT
jgi:hypothetical protein